MSIKTIVAAFALESEDDPVAGRAIQLAKQHDARLIAVHAIEGPAPDGHDISNPIDWGAIMGILESEAGDRLRQLFEAAPISADVIVETGRPHDVIDRLVRRHGADLVVIGPGKARNVRQKVFGSTADRVVRSSSCPVLVVKVRSTHAYRQVVAAVDFSPMSKAAVKSAASIAPAATMELVHVVEILLIFEQAMAKAGASQAEIERYREAKALAAREELLTVFSDDGGMPDGARIRVMYGLASDVLLRLVKRDGADLLALGTQGRNAVSRLVLGSVARKVLNAASCDVLVVSPLHNGAE